MKKIIMLAGIFLTLTASMPAQISQGGDYRIEQSVIASGGTVIDPVNTIYKIEGTIGQSVAGTNSGSGASYYVRSGFWTAPSLAPTGGGALISGRVVTADGRGIQNVVVALSGGTLFSPRTIQTGSLGLFTFEEVEVGQSYLLTVKSNRFTFAQNIRIIVLLGDVTGIVFEAEPEE